MNYKTVESKDKNIPIQNIIVYGTSENEVEKTDKVEEYIQNSRENTALVVLKVDDWDRDFSPWQAGMPGSPDRNFAGEGRHTLEWMMQNVIPGAADQLNVKTEDVRWYICGYSLAGLFALWAFYETGFFSGVAACSATLWFEGWEDYMEQYNRKFSSDINPAKNFKNAENMKKAVYLSLGGKEPRTSNPVMATIGTCYERQKRWMKADPEVGRLLFEWNPGGHFADPEARVLKGICWLTASHDGWRLGVNSN